MARDLESGSKPLLKDKKRLVILVTLQGNPCFIAAPSKGLKRFVSFAPKEMNITFGSFPKQASLNLGEDLNTGFLRFDYSNVAI